MSDVLVVCDGSSAQSNWQGMTFKAQCRHAINHFGASRNLNLKIQQLPLAARFSLPYEAVDLIRIAAYTYAADQLVSRGSELDVYGKRWRRHFHMAVPVSNPGLWDRSDVKRSLTRTLGFASDDDWEFAFSQAPEQMSQIPFEGSPNELWGNPDSILLLSGGADSLCAVIDAVEHGLRPLPVSHKPSPVILSRQQKLVTKLRSYLPSWEFPHLPVEIHRTGSDAVEDTQRTRAFLYATLGSTLAVPLGITKVMLCDNGIVTLNLPINGQLVGALASRSTHPKFLYYFNDLITRVFATAPKVENTLWKETRSEALSVLNAHGMAQLLQLTVSCAHTRNMSPSHPHCGICSQCIDRRFGTLAAGLEEHDIGEKYAVNIFTDEIREGTPRTLAESYVRFARIVDGAATHQELLQRFPQFYDCLVPGDTDPESTMYTLLNLIKRHARNVLDVMANQISLHSKEIARGLLPESCLISLARMTVDEATGSPKTPPIEEIPQTPEDVEIRNLLDQVLQIPAGKAEATNYHNSVYSLVQFVFDKVLNNFDMEYKVDGGYGRIDIIADNRAESGQFAKWRSEYHASSIPIECKNYNTKVGNAELNQIDSRLGEDTSRLGFLFCRTIRNSADIASQAKIRWDRHGNCILVFDDNDLAALVRMQLDNDLYAIERLIALKIRAVRYGAPPVLVNKRRGQRSSRYKPA